MQITKIFFRISFLISFLLLISSFCFAATFNPNEDYKTIDTKHFSIHFPEELENTAQRLANIAEDVHSRLSPKFKWTPWGKTQVLLLDSADTVNDMASVLPYNWIYIRAAAPGPESSLGTYDDWLYLVFTHEYTHILHLDKYKGFWVPFRIIFDKLVAPNGATPGWLIEGIAVYEETVNTYGGRGRATFSDMIIRTAVFEDKFLGIDQADGLQWDWPSGNSRYIYGVKFLQFMAAKYGEAKLYEFFEKVAGSALVGDVGFPARNTFSDIQYESVKIGNRYAKIKKTGTPRSKTFTDFWKEWKAELEIKYKKLKSELMDEGVTPFEIVAKGKKRPSFLLLPTISPDGKSMVYTMSDPFGRPNLMIHDFATGKSSILKKNIYSSSIEYSHDGRFLILSKKGTYKSYSYFSDLYKYNLEKKKLERLTYGMRMSDPDLSPDDKSLVCISQMAGAGELVIYNLEDKSFKIISSNFPKYTQFSKPKFSPDGETIAVVISEPDSFWDLYILDKQGRVITQVTDSRSIQSDPVWGPDGKLLYFISDASGISNVYQYNLKTKKIQRMTNVLTGVFDLALFPNGKEFVVKYYNGEGYDIRKAFLPSKGYSDKKTNFDKDISKLRKKELKKYGKYEAEGSERKNIGFDHGNYNLIPYSDIPGQLSSTTEEGAGFNIKYPSKKYTPFRRPLFLPRYIVPSAAWLDDAALIMLMTGGADPLKWHNWVAGANYRTDSEYVGFFFKYWYNRFKPIFDMGVVGYSVDFGTLTFNYTSGLQRNVHLYERRLQAFAGVTYPFGRHAIRFQYFLEDRQPTNTNITGPEQDTLNLGRFGGFRLIYGFSNAQKFAASITRSAGRTVKIGFTVTNKIFLSSDKNEQYIFAGDWREYFNPVARHVLAIRVAGGIAWGDQLRQGTFSMGGAIGEGALAAGGSLYYYPLRGLPVAALQRDRAMLMSAEYRIPLVHIGRGLGTSPLFVQDIYIAGFADYGNSWNANQSTGSYFFNNFFLGVGGELAANVIIGHGLPLTGRVGYGIIVVNRDRLGNLQDPILNHSARDGVFILQLGTSF